MKLAILGGGGFRVPLVYAAVLGQRTARVVLVEHHHRGRGRRLHGDDAEQQRERPRQAEDEQHTGHAHQRKRRLPERDPDDAAAQPPEVRGFENCADVEQDQPERHFAQEPEGCDVLVRHQVECRRSKCQTDQEVTGDLRHAHQLRQMAGDDRRDQDQADRQDLVHRDGSTATKYRWSPSLTSTGIDARPTRSRRCTCACEVTV